jgi:hypothetical protein
MASGSLRDRTESFDDSHETFVCSNTTADAGNLYTSHEFRPSKLSGYRATINARIDLEHLVELTWLKDYALTKEVII